MSILIFDRVVRRYGDRTAVADLSFDVRPGEIFGLLGPNGAGKSTTVHLAVGLLGPDAGTVRVDGDTPSRPAVRARIGVAPQAPALYELMTGDENLAFFGRLYGLRGQMLAEHVSAALTFVGLSDRRRDRVDSYSGGMKRRLNLAAGLLHAPDLMLLDEPTVGVDPQSRHAIFESILALKAEGRAVVYTTHYMEEAERLCDRVAIIDHGRLLALDTVPALLATHGGPPTLVVDCAGTEVRVETRDPLGELNQLARTRQISGFRVEGPTLEQVFLHLTGHALRD